MKVNHVQFSTKCFSFTNKLFNNLGLNVQFQRIGIYSKMFHFINTLFQENPSNVTANNQRLIFWLEVRDLNFPEWLIDCGALFTYNIVHIWTICAITLIYLLLLMNTWIEWIYMRETRFCDLPKLSIINIHKDVVEMLSVLP